MCPRKRVRVIAAFLKHRRKEVGVLGAVAGVIGNLQALEAIRYLTHIGELLTGRLLSFDFATMKTRTVSFPKNPHCIGCGTMERS